MNYGHLDQENDNKNSQMDRQVEITGEERLKLTEQD